MTDEITPSRIFKIGTVRLAEDASMHGKSTAEIQKMLIPLYPQVENATVRERTEDIATLIEFIPRAGRKG